jgi:hypothetical protein
MAHIDEIAVLDEESEEGLAPQRPKNKGKGKGKDDDEDDDNVDTDGDDGASPRPSPEEVRRLIMTELSVPPEIAGAALGVGRNSAYQAIHKKQIAANRVGNKLTCPTAPLRRQLGWEPPLPGGEPAPQAALLPKKPETIKSPKRRRRR